MKKAIGNWRSSLYGSLSGALLWWAGVGFKIPETKQEWAFTLGSLAMVMWGLSGKDGATGSPPGANH